MNNQSSLQIWQLLVVISILTLFNACSESSRNSVLAEKLGAINFLIETSQGSVSQIPEEVRIKLSRQSIEKFPGNRPELEDAVRAAIPYYENDIRRFEEIANKYDEIVKLNISSETSRSAQNQKIKFQKYRAMIEKQKSRLELILDAQIVDKSKLYEKTSAIENEIGSLENEIKNLEATGGRISKDKP